MNPLNHSTLGLFLTEKSSLSTWEQAGILSREIAPYNILAEHFKTIFIFSYGDEDDYQYQKYLAPNIKIIPKPKTVRRKNYNWTLPFRHWRQIYQCQFLKTNQFRCRAALIAKIIHPRSKLILRTGYTASLFEKQENHAVNSWLSRWEKIAYHLCDIGTVTSRNDQEYLTRTYRLAPRKIQIIPNYIDTDLFRPIPQTKYRDKVIYVGRLHQQKNLPVLIKALTGTAIGLDIVGGGQRPAEYTAPQEHTIQKSLQQLAEEQGVEVRFLGLVPNNQLPSLLNRYALFVLPSLYEGMPKALLEAMSCGLTCIATAVTGSEELIKHEVTGLLAKANDPESLRATIKKAVKSPEQQYQLGQAARKFIIDNYSLSSQINKELAIYRQWADVSA